MSVAAGQGTDTTPLPPNYARGPVATPRSGKPDSEAQDEAKLIRRLLNYISMSDRYEEQRRKTDRVGGNIYYGRHWNVQVATNRAAITCNVARTLVDHKIAIMTKQKPVPVIEAIDVGDAESAQLMRSTIMGWWERDEMGRKLERALYLANTTRSSALKGVWDTTLLNGIGDITFDVLPGWKIIVDGRTDDPDRMQFAGDRTLMPRSRAMMLYPKAADKIEEAPAHRETGPAANASGGGSPIRDQWQRSTPTFPTTAIVNSVPMLLSYSGDVPHASVSAELVQVVELYIRDFRMAKITQVRRDRDGNTDMEPVLDKDGLPQFEQTQSESFTSPEGIPFSVPRFQLMLQPVVEEVYIRKYPFWRRCTLLIDAAPDARLIEDIAWDYPLPYAYCHDGDVLEGFWRRGCILDLESLQGALNVSISTMLDNLRFSAYRAYIAYNGSMIERNNMNIAPGEILRAGEKGTLEPLPVPEISQAWFSWVQMVISLMERVIGASGIMQGQAQGRVDSAAGYDMLAEIGGSVLVKCTQRMERTIADATKIAGAFMQRHYYDGHRAVAIEDANGQEHYERIAPGALFGQFTYKVLTGSSLAWSETAVRERVLEELQQGLRDKISAWKALHVEDWQAIFDRMTQDAQQQGMPAAAQAAPPPRTRRSLPSQKTQRMNQGPGAFG